VAEIATAVRASRLVKLADEATGAIVADAATRERAGAGIAFRGLGPRGPPRAPRAHNVAVRAAPDSRATLG